MGTWAGFLRHATAQGLRVNLFHFGLVDQPDRWQVFLSLLRLQYGWPLLALMLLGFVGLMVSRPRLGVLWISYLAGHLLFTLNSVQDVMAYLLNVFVPLGVPLAVGLVLALSTTSKRWLHLALVGSFTLLVVGRVTYTFPRISLHDWRDADGFVDALQARFGHQGGGVALLSDWEHLTPYFYSALVEGNALHPGSAPVYVTGAQPWGRVSSRISLSARPTSLPIAVTYVTWASDCDRGDTLASPGATSHGDVTPNTRECALFDDRIEILGTPCHASPWGRGSFPLVLYAPRPADANHDVMPWVSIGGIEQRFTTDSRHLTPEWLQARSSSSATTSTFPSHCRSANTPSRCSRRVDRR